MCPPIRDDRLDTNILVRFFTQDDPIQSAKATEIMEHRLTVANPGEVSLATMVELAWVLSGTYSASNANVADAVEHMLGAQTLVLQNSEQVAVAAEALRDGNASFADALIGALGAWAGCSATLTFDKRAKRINGFEAA